MSTQDASCAPFAKNRSARITEHTQRWDPILVFVRHNFIFYVGIMTTLFMFVFFSLVVLIISDFLPSEKNILSYTLVHFTSGVLCLCEMFVMSSPFELHNSLYAVSWKGWILNAANDDGLTWVLHLSFVFRTQTKSLSSWGRGGRE